MKDLKPAILLCITFTVICGGIYPALVTAIAQAVFPHQANGSIISDQRGKEIGSRLIGQPFSDAKYFWSRPSATSYFAYNPLASGGSNAGPTNPDYLKTVSERVKVLRASGITGPIPADLVQASASGLDPHLSLEAALVQVSRISNIRKLSPDVIRRIIAVHTEDRQFGVLGEPRVNVLVLNTELDKLTP